MSYILRPLIIFDVPIQMCLVFTNYQKMLKLEARQNEQERELVFLQFQPKSVERRFMKDHELYFSCRVNKLAEILVLLISL